MKPRLALFDLDHTLLEGDSDVLWCAYLMDQGVLDRASFEPRNAAMERDYRAGTVSVQDFNAFYVSTLAGRTPAQWEATRQAFLKDVVAPRRSAAARALVKQQISEGATVVLTTATNRFITELTAVELGIAHLIATDCEVAADGPLAGRFTGKPQGVLNMREGKVTRLHAWLAQRGQQLEDFDSWAWSDSMNDLPLLQAVDHPVATHPDLRLAALAAERGWPVLHLHGPMAGRAAP